MSSRRQETSQNPSEMINLRQTNSPDENKNNDDDINFNMNKVVKRFKRKYYILIAIQLLLLPVLTTLNLNFLTLIYSSKYFLIKLFS